VWNLVSEIEEAKPKTTAEPSPQRSKKAQAQLERMRDKFRIIGGVKVDFESGGRLNYGSLVCLANYNEEVLCVDQYNDVCIKHMDDVDYTDFISLKVIDLAEPNNQKNIEYGDFIWLQVLSCKPPYLAANSVLSYVFLR